MSARGSQRVLLRLASVLVMVTAYTVASNAYWLLGPSRLPAPLDRLLRPDVLPPTQDVARALVSLVSGRPARAAAGHASGHVHLAVDHVGYLLDQGVSLQGALLVSARRVLLGVLVGAPLGVLAGLAMGWSRRVDEYVHWVYVLLRSIPPLALITYVMLWLGHGEAHLLVPIVYAVVTTVAIPTYHGVRDLAVVYVRAARALGAGGWQLLGRVVLPAASPAILGAVRYSLIIAWMTTVGAEMLMATDGMGPLLVGGGLWSSRTKLGVDPAVVIVGILALATLAYLMDTVARMASERLTFWAGARRQW